MKYRVITSLLIITYFLLFGTQLFAQQVSDDDVKEYAKERYPELFLPKDEFETTAEYEQRLKRKRKIIKEMKVKMIAEIQIKKVAI